MAFFLAEGFWTVALLSAKLSEKRKSSEMIDKFNKLCMYETRQTLARNTGQTAERKEDSLTEGVKSNSKGKPASAIRSRDIRARQRQKTEITHVRIRSQVLDRLKSQTTPTKHLEMQSKLFFLLDAAWVRSRAERPSVSYTKVTSKVAWTSHNLQVTNKLKRQNCGSNKIRSKRGGTGR